MKKWYLSKTINANLVLILGAVSAFLTGEVSGEAAIATVVTNIVNIVLRLVTTSPVGSGNEGGGGSPLAILALVSVLLAGSPAFAQVLIAVDIERQSLAWDAPTTGGAVGEYRVKCGPATGNYTKVTPVPAPATTLPVKDGIDGLGAWFCVVTAANQFGESGPSNEISFEAGMKPGAPGNLILRGQ